MRSASEGVAEALSTTRACDHVRPLAPEALFFREVGVGSAVLVGLVLLFELNILSDRSGSVGDVLDVRRVCRPRLWYIEDCCGSIRKKCAMILCRALYNVVLRPDVPD